MAQGPEPRVPANQSSVLTWTVPAQVRPHAKQVELHSPWDRAPGALGGPTAQPEGAGGGDGPSDDGLLRHQDPVHLRGPEAKLRTRLGQTEPLLLESDLQAEQVALGVPPQTHPVPVRQGQGEREPVADPQEPPVQGLLVPLQTQLRSERVHRAVCEGHPGSGGDHTHVHTHGDLEERRHGELQGPVVLAAVQHGFGVSQEISRAIPVWEEKFKVTKQKKITSSTI